MIVQDKEMIEEMMAQDKEIIHMIKKHHHM